MSEKLRKERLERLIRNEIAKNIDGIINNSLVTIKSVSLSHNFRHAKVFVSIFPENNDVFKKINEKKGYIRRILAKNLNLKYTPELEFVMDKENL